MQLVKKMDLASELHSYQETEKVTDTSMYITNVLK